MAKTPNVRNIQLTEDVVTDLIIQGAKKGYKGFKAYAEAILIHQSVTNELTDLQKKSN